MRIIIQEVSKNPDPDPHHCTVPAVQNGKKKSCYRVVVLFGYLGTGTVFVGGKKQYTGTYTLVSLFSASSCSCRWYGAWQQQQYTAAGAAAASPPAANQPRPTRPPGESTERGGAAPGAQIRTVAAPAGRGHQPAAQVLRVGDWQAQEAEKGED